MVASRAIEPGVGGFISSREGETGCSERRPRKALHAMRHRNRGEPTGGSVAGAIVRTHGRPPYGVAVVHGGPGAGGEMEPVARVVARQRGVLEPIQTADSVNAQVAELRRVLEREAALPAVLVGFSWGAWLSFILAARHQGLVRKLVMIGSGPFAARYATEVGARRMERLTEEERDAFERARAALNCGTTKDRDAALARLGALARKADAYDPLPQATDETIVPDAAIFEKVWCEASELRERGVLLELGLKITCPVVAIHGDYDPHPAEGVRRPLASVVEDFEFLLLECCGHVPWIERQARATFFRVLQKTLST